MARPSLTTARCLVTVVALAVVWPVHGQLRANRRPARPEVTLPEGPVREIIRSSCTACHGIDEYGYYAMDRDAWSALIDRMETATSGLIEGTEIDDPDREILLDWLVAEFGPDADYFERQYVVREVTDETRLTDDRAMTRFSGACESCHSPLEPILSTELDEEQWRTILTGKIATGTPILIDEVDPLVDWLINSR
jgi:cytochrome c5